jgi:hypothetical protein
LRRKAGTAGVIAGLAGEIRMRYGTDEVNAMTEGRYRLIGSTALPYAIKLRALLRQLGELREKFAALRPVLERAGCWQHLANGS